jgi:hypothetical protein
MGIVSFDFLRPWSDLMLYPRRYRWMTLGLLAAYLAATTLGGLLHDHDHGSHDGCAGVCTSHDHDDAACDCHEHEQAIAYGDSDGSPLADDDACSVCRFIGQRTTPVEPVQFAAISDACAEVVLAHPVQSPVSFPRTTQSRAPPSVA